MKKKILFPLLVLFNLVFCFADVNAILSVNPYFLLNNYPAAPIYYDDAQSDYLWKVQNPDTWNNLDSNWWMKRQDYWLQAYDNPSFLDFGFEVDTNNFDLVLRVDIMQDLLPCLEDFGSVKTNIPFVGGLLDLTFPRVSYMDFISNDKSWYVSLGRRLIKWGPAFYDTMLSNSQPYLDNLWVDYKTPMKADSNWKFNFNYVIVSPKFWLQYHDADKGEEPNEILKTFIGHKFSFYNDYVRLSLGEFANVYNKTPSLFDLSPLIVWHNGNQDGYVNVALYLAAEGKVGPVRMYGTFNMDDFDLPHETHSDKPMAMGFVAGAEYHILDGTPVESEQFTRNDYILREDSFDYKSGLNVGFEWYFVSPMMYNRTSKDRFYAGKFTVPAQIISLTGENYIYDKDAYFLGFKYGPNARLFRLFAEYIDKPFEITMAAELLTRGEYGIESFYGNRDKLDEMGVIDMLKLAGAKTSVLLFETDFAYYLQDSLKIVADLDLQFDFTHKKNAYKIGIGFSCNPLTTDWKNLF